MRLTLRTLLAYMDDILEPEDREDIAQKLKNNENATALLHRIRDVTRRLRLGAPQVIGNGMGRDPNSVAEYLESTLAPEQVLLIERVCLESDVHLAEVGAAHHIVTMILSEPAQVDPASRQRMYTLIDQPSPQHVDEPSAAAVAVAASAPAGAAATSASAPMPSSVPMPLSSTPDAADEANRRKPEVPEYLRASTGLGWKPIVLTLVGAALITAVVLGALNRDRVMRALSMNQPSVEENPPEAALPSKAGENVSAADIKAPPKVTPAVPPLAPVDKAPNVDKAPAVVTPKGPAVAPVEATPKAALPAEPVKAAVGDPSAPAPVPPAAPSTDAPPRVTPPAVKGADVVAVPVPIDVPAPGTPPGTPAPPAVPVEPAKQPDQVATNDTKIPPKEAPDVTPAAPVAIGRILSQGQILLRSRQPTDRWERLPATAAVHVGDRLLVLPAFRPLLSINGVSLELDGPSEVQLGPSGADGIPQLSIAYGRLIFRSLGQPNSRLRINTGAGEGVVTFGDAESKFGVQVRLVHVPGTDPEKVSSARQVELYADSGKVDWTTATGSAALTAPKRLLLADGVLADAADNTMPPWIAASQVSPLDARAVPRIEEAMTADRSVKLSLTELLLQRQVEVRTLAARACAYVGMFDPLVAGLADEDQRGAWPMLVAELQGAVARDPQSATAVRETFERLRREKSPDLYRMLWGYTPAGLKNGDARRLVEMLDHEDLDFRVLAYTNLWQITRMGLSYYPEKSAANRKSSLIRWQKRLDEGKIVYADTVPAPAPGRPVPKGAPPGAGE